MKSPTVNNGIIIGTNREAVAEARKAIVDILESSAEQKTKRVALEVLTKLCAPTNTGVSNCSFGAKE